MSASWYNSAWAYRQAITVDAVSKGTSPIDITIVVPPDSPMWDTCNQTDGRDIRVCDSDGKTLLTYDLDGFVAATRTLTIEVDAYDISELVNKVFCIWLYWGNAAATAASTTFSPASAASGYIALEVPAANRIIVCVPEDAEATKPRNVITKPAAEDTFLYWDITPLMQERREAYQGTQGHEGPRLVQDTNVTLAGVNQASMHGLTYVRFIEWRSRMFIRSRLAGGTTAVDYTATITFKTRLNQLSTTLYDARWLSCRALVKVRDVDET